MGVSLSTVKERVSTSWITLIVSLSDAMDEDKIPLHHCLESSSAKPRNRTTNNNTILDPITIAPKTRAHSYSNALYVLIQFPHIHQTHFKKKLYDLIMGLWKDQVNLLGFSWFFNGFWRIRVKVLLIWKRWICFS